MHSDREKCGIDDWDPAEIRQLIGNDVELSDTRDSFHAIETLFERVRLPDEMSQSFATEVTRLDLPGFEEMAKIGSGGFGAVFLAYDQKLEREVAVKVPRADRLLATDEKHRFLEEARLAAKLQHPGIVTLFELIEHDDRYHLVSEYVDGTTLQDVLEEDQISWPQATTIALRTAEALEHAHAHQVIHRDLKPTNILIDSDGNPKIADFGLAIRKDSTDLANDPTAGTVEYMSPEQLPTSGKPIDQRTDIWSFGVVLYEMITGSLPFSGASRAELFSDIRDAVPISPRSIRPDIPSRLEQICLKCLEKEPERRYASFASLATELRRFSNHSRTRRIACISLVLVAAVAMSAFFVGRHYFNPEFNPSNLVAEMKIHHYRFDPDNDTGVDLGTLGEDSGRIIENDSINLEVQFSQPAYFHLVELTSSGKIINHFSTDADDAPVEKMRFPIEADFDLNLDDGPGSCMFAVVSSTSPLPTFETWQKSNPAIPWQASQHDGIWKYRNGRIHEMELLNRSSQRRRKTPPEAIARACEQLQESTNTSICAIAFPISPKPDSQKVIHSP